jgi:hypothetical protein
VAALIKGPPGSTRVELTAFGRNTRSFIHTPRGGDSRMAAKKKAAKKKATKKKGAKKKK